MTTAAIQPVDQVTAAIGPAVDVYNRLNVIRNVLAPDLNDQELQLFAIVAERSRLDPFAKQIYAIKRGGRVTFQTGIDGFRSSAEETGEYRGSDEPEFGPIVDKPFPHPEWARVVVHRQFADGSKLDQPKTVYWDEYYPGGQNPGQWNKMPRNQLAKCAEAGAFRMAFPKRFSDVYTAEEMDQADAAAAARPVAPTAAERVAARRAELEASTAGNDATKTVPEQAEDVVDGLFTETDDDVDQETGEIAWKDDIVTRLKRGYAEHWDLRHKMATDEQKAEIRALFDGIDHAVIINLLDAGFENTPGPDGKFKLNRGEATALLLAVRGDRDAFLREAAELSSMTS